MSEVSLRSVAESYLSAGWHPLELPAHAKSPPAEGRTGYGGVDMTAAEVEAAAWAGNIGIRMPVDVIGLDVDCYKGGRVTLLKLGDTCGPLPNTWISHSGRNDGSGIRFYRVPVGMSWIAGLPGMEIIQRGHRYAAVWPSNHPDGRQYGWWDQAEGGPSDTVPMVEDLPELPWSWQAELSRATVADIGERATAVDLAGVEAFVDAHNRADKPSYIATIVVYFTERTGAGFSRHDTMQHCLTWSLECVRAGLAAAEWTVKQLADVWQTAVRDDARRAELWSTHRTTEFEAMLRHAIGKVNAKPAEEIAKIHDDIAGPVMNVASPPTIDDYHPAEGDGGIFLDWAAFAGRDESDRRWLVEDFWPWGRAVALWAAAKAGKSELALWCAVQLALGRHPWTGAAIEPIEVAYFDYEMTADDLDERLSDFDVDPLLLPHLHYALLPPLHALDVEQGGIEVETLVAGVHAQAVIFDTFGRAVSGDENEADTVRAFYRHTGARLKRLGVGYLRTDHAGKDQTKGQRGTSAKRDDVDVIWAMRRTDNGVLLDCSGSSRLSWVGPTLTLDRVMVNGELSYSAPVRLGWSSQTIDKAHQLDRLGAPIAVSKRQAREILRAANERPGNDKVLLDALRLRRERGAGTTLDPSQHHLDGST